MKMAPPRRGKPASGIDRSAPIAFISRVVQFPLTIPLAFRDVRGAWS
jgi:hypothetical protein